MVAGDLVEVRDHADRLIGWGFYHPTSQYRVRIVAWPTEGNLRPDVGSVLDLRAIQAARLRRCVGLPSPTTTAWRLLNSEGDGVSGLTVDVFADGGGTTRSVAVVLASAAWVDRYRWRIEQAIASALAREVSFLHRVSPTVVEQEGFDISARSDTSSDPIEILEHGLRFLVDLAHGQKTGFYLDQRDNRALVRTLAGGLSPGSAGGSAGPRVLDAFCYTGGFALSAAAGGAAEVLGVDSSSIAIGLARENARRNGLADRIQFEQADALSALEAESRAFDLVVCDPPKFARSARDLDAALAQYHRVNRAAFRAVAPGGMLVTCSCSSAVRRDRFLEVLREAATEAGRRFTVTHIRGAASDHPVHPAYPEGEYLTCVVGIVQ